MTKDKRNSNSGLKSIKELVDVRLVFERSVAAFSQLNWETLEDCMEAHTYHDIWTEFHYIDKTVFEAQVNEDDRFGNKLQS